jgi:hypothetical protein
MGILHFACVFFALIQVLIEEENAFNGSFHERPLFRRLASMGV